ncbi:hypothetical protein DIZ70_09850 [Acinetobacter junii]|uniref:BESS domain-containing protein n=1 Tax=Acinetobacter haemolyticus TaxID=29430 RepID=A0AAJ2YUQ8_ACIHA|nr:hypothetical protein [Acinetobacter haemolyticus]TIE04125.1 hypothetical protein DIZ70_09850 [Acinetobacter junii]NAR37129.1 hypothetical protein [Acinetobacter haemolyticus]NAR48496.1 hypothetical protein [Acinetobacter haemolyticus]NAR64855.1 hypothetical protein [Acinetobacter haemolyticus]
MHKNNYFILSLLPSCKELSNSQKQI